MPGSVFSVSTLLVEWSARDTNSSEELVEQLTTMFSSSFLRFQLDILLYKTYISTITNNTHSVDDKAKQGITRQK